MTLGFWATSRRAGLALFLLLSASCALPRAGTNSDGGVVGVDSGVDSAVRDSGPICDPPDCNDGNPCTDDLCTATGCEPVFNTDPCEDGDFCNGFDTCEAGACTVHSGDPCSAPTVCNDVRQACVGCNADDECMDNVPEWSSCDFGGSACELNGTRSRMVTRFSCDLTSRECVGTPELQTEACSRPAAETNGASCSAGAAAGLCQGGACCTGCLDGSTCRAGSSNSKCGAAGLMCRRCTGSTPQCSASGSCVECTTDSHCDDGNANTSDRCVANRCVNTCTRCVNGSGTCVAGTADANCGNGGGSCSACGGGTPFCVGRSCSECRSASDCNDANPCTDDGCSGGSCTHTNNTRTCDDGNGCTVGDQCSGGSCRSGADKVCNDGNGCTNDSCNTSTGACVFTNNTMSCNDGNACTTGDVCGGGSCAGTPMSCDDGNGYTTDSCSGGSCVNTCMRCTSGGTCVSGRTATACGNGGGACMNCSAMASECTIGTCSAGSCTFANKADGTTCSSGVCVAGVCVECRISADCPSTTAARCSANVCTPCTIGGHCTHLSGTTTCDRSAGVDTGVCVPDGSCTSGCLISSTKTCAVGTATPICGINGNECVDCTGTSCRTSGAMAGTCAP